MKHSGIMIILLLIVAVGIAFLFINQMDSLSGISSNPTTKTTDVPSDITQQAKDAVDALNGKINNA